MTEKTVAVPVELLQELKREYPGAIEAVPGGPLSRLVELIPSPPKVGDVLTAEQIAELPAASVMRDEDGDVLVKIGNVVRRVTMGLWNWDEVVRWSADDFDTLVADYSVTLVSLPDACD